MSLEGCGCWNGNNNAGYAAACRSGYRSNNYNNNTNPSNSNNYWGFRVACFPAAQGLKWKTG